MRPAARPVVAASALVALALAGCGSGSDSGPESGAVALHDRRLVLIAGAGPGSGGGRGGLIDGARAEAARLGLRLTVHARPGISAGEQIRIVDAVIAAKPGAVLIAPVDAGALAAPIASLRQAGIVTVPLPGGRRHAATTAAVGAAGVRRAARALRAVR